MNQNTEIQESRHSLHQPQIIEMANKATTPYKSNSSINFNLSEHKISDAQQRVLDV